MITKNCRAGSKQTGTRELRGQLVLSITLPCLLQLFGLCLGQEPIPRFQTTTNLVLLDVRVLDGDGRPVRGLKAEDFTVQEERVVQKVSYFREVSLPLTTVKQVETREPSSEPPSAESPSPDNEVLGNTSSPVTTPEKRLLIFLFDLSSAGLQEIASMGEAAQSFLEEQFSSYDSAAVLILDSGLEMLTDLTSDPDILRQAFQRLTSGNPEMDVSIPDEETESSTEFVADETEFALFQANQQLGAIQSIADAFREVPGRKALLYFSTGMRSTGVETEEQMRWTTDMCNRANMSIYAVDARGLVALSPGGGAHRAGGRGTSIFSGRASLNQLASLVESQNSLVTLSADTGGAALLDDNDFSRLLRQALEEGSHYYLLGYYVPTPPRDGQYRRVEVRTRVTYARVESRKGYYAEKPYRSLTQAEKEFKLLQAVIDDLPAAELPLSISAEYFPDAQDQYQVAVLLSFDYSQVSTVSGAEDLNLEVIILARDLENRARAALRDKLEIRPRRPNEETRFVYENLLVLDPGEYQLVAYIRDNTNGKMSKTLHSLQLPPAAPIRLSSLVLAGRWKELETQTSYRIKRGEEVSIRQNPLQINGRSLIPRVGAIFEVGETIYIHGTASPQGDSQKLDYRIILSDEQGNRLFEGDWKRLTAASDGRLSINARLPLNQLAPGRYEVSAEVRTAELETLQLFREFTVVPLQRGS